MIYKQLFESHTKELRDLLDNLEKFHEQTSLAAEHLHESFSKGGRAFVAGNGGSASEAQHLAEEFIGRYRTNRIPYPMISLTADSNAITCIANDFGFSEIYSRQIEALGQEGDVFIGLSTSGNSENILKAAESARVNGMTVIALTGTAGKFREMADIAIEAPAPKIGDEKFATERMQELHLHAIHMICETFEEESRSPKV
ncbi:MAG TPA: SIS domain-containing protein [Candidatus Andersenbacteria bacterium]|nr:SIS domain-containing protein [Candidatus Andersenbacteria bacterium]